jgi:hypothetical protein
MIIKLFNLILLIFLILFFRYGKTRTAKLIIETDDMVWTYGIRGILPKY